MSKRATMSALKGGMVVKISQFGDIFFVKPLTEYAWIWYNITKKKAKIRFLARQTKKPRCVMADKKQMESSKIDALYSWISYDLQKVKSELLSELKYSSVQISSLHQDIKDDNGKSSQAISQEIRYSYKQNQTIYDGLARMLTEEVGERLGAIESMQSTIQDSTSEVLNKLAQVNEEVGNTVQETLSTVTSQLEDAVNEIKYSYAQQQAVYDGLSALIQADVVSKLDDVQAKLATLEQIDATLVHIHERLAAIEESDYKSVIESVAEKTEECVEAHSRQILDAVAAIPVAENIDYNRVTDEVGDKVLEILSDIMMPAPVATEEKKPAPVEAKIDYDRIAYGAAEKVVESLPYPDKVDYRRIQASFEQSAQKVQASVDSEVLSAAVATAVAQAISALDLDALASKVAEKIVIPVVEAPQIDYERLADMVAEKLAKNADQTYDVMLDEAGVSQIAEKVAQKLDLVETTDYARIASIVEEKLNAKPEEETTYELAVDEAGVQAIAKSVCEEMRAVCESCKVAQPVVEEVAEVVEETPVEEELAVAVAPEMPEVAVVEPVVQKVDAEAGLVDRLNRSFTAKLKQSEDKVKNYYSAIRNELTSYKKVRSNISWNGDRFNLGRETIAKVIIRGKTLRFLLALDPDDAELKESVYHQQNVSDQKAHQDTPFMVKVSSDMGLKKAVRLVGILATKKGAQKLAEFVPVDYAQEFEYQDDATLEATGFIKRTKEKKVDFNF